MNYQFSVNNYYYIYLIEIYIQKVHHFYYNQKNIQLVIINLINSNILFYSKIRLCKLILSIILKN